MKAEPKPENELHELLRIIFQKELEAILNGKPDVWGLAE